MTTIEYIDVDQIDPHPQNPRRDVGDVRELAKSIAAQGVRQNLLLVPHNDDIAGYLADGDTAGAHVPQRYRVVIGHRRLEASKLAGLTTVPAVIDDSLSPTDQLELMLLENIQRTDLTPIEEAEGYQQLLDLGVTAAAIAKKTGVAVKTVRGRVQLLALPEVARERIHNGQASLLDAAKLEKLDPDTQAALASVIGTKDFEWKVADAIRIQKLRVEQQALVAALQAAGLSPVEPHAARGSYLGRAEKPSDIEGLIGDRTGLVYALSDHSAAAWIYATTEVSAAAVADVTAAAEQAARDAQWQAEREALDKDRAERQTAYETRDEFVRSLTTKAGKAAKLTAVQRDAILQAAKAVLWTGFGPQPKTVAMWLDPEHAPDGWWPNFRDNAATMAATEPWASLDAGLHLLIWIHLVTQDRDWSNLQPVYAMLGRLGYVPSEVEADRLTAASVVADTDEQVA